MQLRQFGLILGALGIIASQALGDTITISGSITQSTADGTGPAVNNPSLNNVLDGQGFTITLGLPGPVNSPGMYSLTGSSLTLSDAPAIAKESAFGMISLTVTGSGSTDQFSLLGCLTTGSGCSFGDSLSANFSIPAAQLNVINVAATGMDQPHPMDLLEDDGTTDIQGSITKYSYAAAAATPEPGTWMLAGLGLIGLTVARSGFNAPTKRTKGVTGL